MAEARYLYVYPSDALGQTKVDGHHALRTVAAAGIDESGSEDDSPGAKHAHFGSGARGSSVLVDYEDLDRAPRLLSRKLVSVQRVRTDFIIVSERQIQVAVHVEIGPLDSVSATFF